MQTFRFTAHAIERYIDRLDRGSSHASAMAVLYEACAGARLMPQPSPLGDPMYEVTDPPMRWIVKQTPREAVVVTILRGSEAPDYEALREAEQEVIDAHRRVSGLLPAPLRTVTARVGPGSPAGVGRAAAARWVTVELARASAYKEHLRTVRRALLEPPPARTERRRAEHVVHVLGRGIAAGW